MKPPRILIVDDEPDNLELLQFILEREGFVVSLAESGEEAILVARERMPDVVLLDVMMPDMNGYETALNLKAHAATVHIPIIMLTALDDFASRMQARSAGAEGFHTKPVNRIALCSTIRMLLAQ